MNRQDVAIGFLVALPLVAGLITLALWVLNGSTAPGVR